MEANIDHKAEKSLIRFEWFDIMEHLENHSTLFLHMTCVLVVLVVLSSDEVVDSTGDSVRQGRGETRWWGEETVGGVRVGVGVGGVELVLKTLVEKETVDIGGCWECKKQ